MKIKKVNKIKNLHIYSNFRWSADIPEFSKFNLIYGWNGVGKTTLSNIFSFFDSTLKYKFEKEVEFELETTESVKYDQSYEKDELPIRVFNKKFVDENINWEGSAKKILYIGEENAKVAEDIKKKEKSLKSKGNDKIKAEKASRKATKDYNASLTETATIISQRLSQYDSSKFTRYNRKNLDPVIKSLNQDEIDKLKPDIERINEIEKQLKQEAKPKINSLNENLSRFEDISDEVNEVLGKEVIASTIEELKNNPQVQSWVETGLKYHSRENSTCQFCGNEISETRFAELEGHFSDAVKNLQARCLALITKVKGYSFDISLLPQSSKFYDNLQKDYSTCFDGVAELAKTYNQEIEKAVKALEEKKANPFSLVDLINVDLSGIESQILENIASANKLIEEHNKVTDDLDSIKKENILLLEKLFYISRIELIEKLKNDSETKQTELTTLETEITSLDGEITTLKAKISDIHKATDVINKYLTQFLGRSEIQLKVKDQGYVIQINGKQAKNLSEGEKTALAFVYFIAKLDEQNFNKKEGIVFIDDPISSFDTNSIYTAVAFIRNHLQECEQLFISTHNFHFLRLVKHWLRNKRDAEMAQKEGRSIQRSYYMIRSTTSGTPRTSSIEKMDKLIADHDSEYEYIYKTLKEYENFQGQLSEAYQIANLARKFLEVYLNFKVPKNSDLKSKFDKIPFSDTNKREEIYKFVNEYSHKGMSHANHVDLTGVGNISKIIGYIQDFIKETDEFHYNQLEALCSA